MCKEELKHAYNPERQAGAVMESQMNNMIFAMSYVLFASIEVKSELGLEWIVMDHMRFLLDKNCNKEAFENLKSRDRLTILEGGCSFKIEDGTSKMPIAAVLHENELLYLSPGFNSESFKAKLTSRRKKRNRQS